MRRRPEHRAPASASRSCGGAAAVCTVPRGVSRALAFSGCRRAASTLKRAGFIDVETSVESALTVLEGAKQYSDFIRNIIFHRHLERLPTEQLRAEFIETLTEQAAVADPPFLLDYWRLNLRGRAA